MIKYHSIISVIIGLLFLVVLQKFATPLPIFRFLLPAFLLLLAVVWLYNRWYLKSLQKYNPWVLVRPALILASGFGVFLVIPDESIRGVFLLFSVAIIAATEYFLGNFAENVLINETLVIAFAVFFSFFGFYFYAPTYQPLYVLGVFLASGLLTRSFYEFIPRPDKTKAVSAIALGLFSSELFWSSNFLHFHYSVLAIFLFNIFYFCLIVNYYHFFKILNSKKVQFHLALIALCSLVVLAVTPWKIVG